MTRLKYDYIMLKEICDEDNVSLLVDYKDKYITRDTRIIGKCILCENSFNKSLNKLHKQRNFGCEACAKILKFEKIKNVMVTKYGVEYASQCQIFKDKIKKTSLERYGFEYANQSEIVKEKIRETNLKTYGVEYGLQSEEIKDKSKNTNLEKYGLENPLQRQEIKDKIKATNIKKYGVEYACQSIEIKDKSKKTNLEKYGYEYGFQSEEVKDKIKATNLEKYGVEYNLQRKEVKDKTKVSNLEKYGVEHIMQCEEFMEKASKSGYKSKDFIMPSGNIIKMQGYEHFALNELFIKENIQEDDIITGCKNVPIIWYYDEANKKHRHYVDIFIKSQNRCIEVKSTWTFKMQENNVLLKQKAGKLLGYDYEIWIYDNKGNKVENICI